MTTPTPAQIEAAEHILDNAIAYATGTKVTISIKQANQIWSALAAAVQAGEPMATAEMYDNRVNEIVAARQKEIETATIERCAQELKRLEQVTFAKDKDDQYALGVNDAIKLAQGLLRKLKNEI